MKPLDFIITLTDASSPFALDVAAAADDDDTIIPPEFICPLTLEILQEPVMTRWGHNFEREAIMRWMECHDQCPITRHPISLKDIIVNRALKAKIQAWKRSQLPFTDISSSETTTDSDQNATSDEIRLPFMMMNVDTPRLIIQAVKKGTPEGPTTGNYTGTSTLDQEELERQMQEEKQERSIPSKTRWLGGMLRNVRTRIHVPIQEQH